MGHWKLQGASHAINSSRWARVFAGTNGSRSIKHLSSLRSYDSVFRTNMGRNIHGMLRVLLLPIDFAWRAVDILRNTSTTD